MESVEAENQEREEDGEQVLSNQIHKLSIPKPNSRSQINSIDVLKWGSCQIQSFSLFSFFGGVRRGAVTKCTSIHPTGESIWLLRS